MALKDLLRYAHFHLCVLINESLWKTVLVLRLLGEICEDQAMFKSQLFVKHILQSAGKSKINVKFWILM